MEQAERRAEGNYMSKDMPVMKETIVGNISQLLAKVETRIDTLVEIVNGDERRDKNVRISQKFIDGTIVSIDDWNVLKITKDNFEGNTSAA